MDGFHEAVTVEKEAIEETETATVDTAAIEVLAFGETEKDANLLAIQVEF